MATPVPISLNIKPPAAKRAASPSKSLFFRVFIERPPIETPSGLPIRFSLK